MDVLGDVEIWGPDGSVVVLARYFDLFQSLASRGLAFIILGIIFVAEAMFYRKMRQAKGGGA